MKGELRWRGANRISIFDHHNINGGDVVSRDVKGIVSRDRGRGKALEW
jgi:hypothetical protein